MNTTIASGHRERLLGHLRNAVAALERGDDHYRFSTVTVSGGASDLVFEVDPVMEAEPDRYTHVKVWHINGLRSPGRPAKWVAGESLR